uniref:C-type lectin domain-containing protein n=1 Tax=Pelusios castaneus TaxID=367368 RepID=A0A8C8S3L6_9SAUR
TWDGSTVAGGSNSSCPEKWKQHGESCYHLPTDWKTWQESKDYCSSLGSNFLKIETKDELDFVKSLTHTYHWIGLSRKTDKEPWLWEDGTQGTLQHCVLLVTIGAKSEFCHERNPCVCEKAVHLEPTALGVEG